MLKNQWTDAPFGFASLNDRRPVAEGDDIVVLAAPDPPGADDAIRISQGGWPLGAGAQARCRGCLRRGREHGAVPCSPQHVKLLHLQYPPPTPHLTHPNPLHAHPAPGLNEGQSLVMFNPRLASGDVGVGLSIRRMRESFLSRFTTTYSLRPIQDVGSVFRRYPGMWQVCWVRAAGLVCGWVACCVPAPSLGRA